MKNDKKIRYFDQNNTPDAETTKVYKVKITPGFLNAQKSKQNKQTNVTKSKVNKNKLYPGKAPIKKDQLERHSRGEGSNGKGVQHPLYKLKLQKKEKKYKFAEEQAARADILLGEEQGFLEVDNDNRTTAITQKHIQDNVDITAATKVFDLNLEFGPYRAKYSNNGRHLLLGSKMGHLAAFDWLTKKLHFEINVMESIHDISWLHIETMIAAAQKEWLYIYDNTGMEIHCIKKMDKILRMEFLPYHFLLAAVNEFGFMTWLDISVGQIAGHYNNHLGRTSVMAQNPYNATVCLGNSQGIVSIWAPTVKDPLAKILCHKTPLTALSVDTKGMYMASAGVDRSLKIWDIRNLDGPVQHYKLRSTPYDLEFSQKDMLAVALNETVEIYNDCCSRSTNKAYLRHRMSKSINNFKFCPYEDVLGIGTNKGFTSIIVPGSGEPNFDALESNPYQTKSQRKEAEVKALLEKIPAELITLNPFEIMEVDVPTMKDKMEAKKQLLHLKPPKIDMKPRNKKKGKTNIARKKIIKEAARKEFVNKVLEVKSAQENTPEPNTPKKSFGVLDRFVAKPKSKK